MAKKPGFMQQDKAGKSSGKSMLPDKKPKKKC